MLNIIVTLFLPGILKALGLLVYELVRQISVRDNRHCFLGHVIWFLPALDSIIQYGNKTSQVVSCKYA